METDNDSEIETERETESAIERSRFRQRFAASFREMGRASGPLVLGATAQVLMTFLDGVFVAHASAAGFSALMLALPLLTLAGALGASLASAAGDFLAKAPDRAAGFVRMRVATQLTLGIGVVLVLAALSGEDALLAFYELPAAASRWSTDLPPNAAADAERFALARDFLDYWTLVAISFPLQMLLSLAMQWFVTRRRERIANLLVLGLAASNAILNPLWIFTAGLGVRGAAIATALSYAFALIAALLLLRAEDRKFYVDFAGAKATIGIGERLRLALQLFQSALGLFAAAAVFSICAALLNRIAAGWGGFALAVYGFTTQTRSIFMFATRGVANAYLILAGRAFAARRTEQYVPLFLAASALVGCVFLPAAISFWIVPDLWAALYDFDPDSEKRRIAAEFLLASGLMLVGYAVPRLTLVGFISLGRRWLTGLQSAAMAIPAVLLTFALEPWLGLRALAWGPLLAELAAGAAASAWFWILLQRRRQCDLECASSAWKAPNRAKTAQESETKPAAYR